MWLLFLTKLQTSGIGILAIYTSECLFIYLNVVNHLIILNFYRYLITPSTVVTFLSHTYRLALCIDLSPSAATVDCVQGTTLLDEILTSFKYFLLILYLISLFFFKFHFLFAETVFMDLPDRLWFLVVSCSFVRKSTLLSLLTHLSWSLKASRF